PDQPRPKASFHAISEAQPDKAAEALSFFFLSRLYQIDYPLMHFSVGSGYELDLLPRIQLRIQGLPTGSRQHRICFLHNQARSGHIRRAKLSTNVDKGIR